MTASDAFAMMCLMSARQVLLVLALCGVTGCAQDAKATLPLPTQPTTTTPSQRFEFTVAPIADAEFVHTIGRSWTGYYVTTASFSRTWGPEDVVAPAAGRVVNISADGSRIDLLAADATRFYLTGLRSVTAWLGREVTAGQVIGRLRRDDRNRLLGIGLGIYRRTPHPFITPARYSDDVLYGDDPIAWFAEPLATQLRAKAGAAFLQFSDDVPGTLMGHWFDESLPIEGSAQAGVNTTSRRLWFFKTERRPGGDVGPPLLRILSLSGVSSGLPMAGSPDPATVTPATGLATFRLEPPGYSSWPELLLVQMLDDSRLRAEVWYGEPGREPTEFSSKARIYIR